MAATNIMVTSPKHLQTFADTMLREVKAEARADGIKFYRYVLEEPPGMMVGKGGEAELLIVVMDTVIGNVLAEYLIRVIDKYLELSA